jgi:hypothetical protein
MTASTAGVDFIEEAISERTVQVTIRFKNGGQSIGPYKMEYYEAVKLMAAYNDPERPAYSQYLTHFTGMVIVLDFSDVSSMFMITQQPQATVRRIEGH